MTRPPVWVDQEEGIIRVSVSRMSIGGIYTAVLDDREYYFVRPGEHLSVDMFCKEVGERLNIDVFSEEVAEEKP